MKIVIGTHSVYPASGGKSYAVNLLEELLDIDSSNQYYLICNRSNEHIFEQFQRSNVRIVSVPFSIERAIFRVLFEQFLLPVILLYIRADVFFAPRNIVPALTPCKSVVTVHSLHMNYQHKMDKFSKSELFIGKVLLNLSLWRATKVIAISDTVKQTLIDYTPKRIVGNKIQVIYHGMKEPTNSEGSAEELLSLKSESYVFFLSQLSQHKNVDKLIDAFAHYKSKTNSEYLLVIGGKDRNNNIKTLQKRCRDLNIADDVLFLGEVSTESIPRLYSNADIFIYPSSIEGFGFPPLEAMANGTPVIASNRTAVPEIVGDAAQIIDPDEIEQFADEIRNITEDHHLRSELKQRGYQRVSKFSWEESAKQTHNLLIEASES